MCGSSVDYTDHIIRDVRINGINDYDIRRDMLGTPDELGKPVNDVVALVENKEMARNALPLPGCCQSHHSGIRMLQHRQAMSPPRNRLKNGRQALIVKILLMCLLRGLVGGIPSLTGSALMASGHCGVGRSSGRPVLDIRPLWALSSSPRSLLLASEATVSALTDTGAQ